MCKLLATPSASAPLRERFLAENGRQNEAAGFRWDEAQEEAEWQRVLEEARTQNTFLRPVHVLAMACVLRRPIIMCVAHTTTTRTTSTRSRALLIPPASPPSPSLSSGRSRHIFLPGC
jgi:hypothetical protein